jgi:regulator of replication initiation timing
MKKFVGNVNGKSFDNEEDFNKAADEAIRKNDGNLSISSYYSYTSDDNDVKKIEDKKDDKFVSTYEYFLGNKKPNNVTSDSVEYEVPESLVQRIKEASNKDSIRKNVEYHRNYLVDGMSKQSMEIDDLQNDIEHLQKRLYEKIDEQKDLTGRRRYYNTLLDILDEAEAEEVKEEVKEEPKKEYVKPVTKKDLKDFFGVDENTSLYSILRQFGILK